MRVTKHSRRGQRQPSVQGSLNGNAKLDELAVAAILEDLALGVRQSRIAERLGVSRELISKIDRRKLWAHIPRPGRGVPATGAERP